VPPTPRRIDDAFLALPLSALTDAALQRARNLGVEHADIRIEQSHGQSLRLRDGRLEGANDAEDVGIGVRVISDGSWGFAATGELTPEAAAWAAEQAVALAAVSRPLSTERVELAPEPVYGDGVHISSYDVDPFDISETDKVALLSDWSHRLLGRDGVAHVDASLYAVKEIKHYADLAGPRRRSSAYASTPT
jgi:TldD protein